MEERITDRGEIDRGEIDDSYLGLLAIIFSDDNLAFEFQLRQLNKWKQKESFKLVALVTEDISLQEQLEKIRNMLSDTVWENIKSLVTENTSIASTKPIERILCYKCRNYGAIVYSRVCQRGQARFLCASCRGNETRATDSISDLIWSRRCNEISQTAAISSNSIIKSLRSEIMNQLQEHFNFMPSIMLVSKEKNRRLVLTSLFTIEKHRGYKFGERLIKCIGCLSNGNYSTSICTAGLDSDVLFGKFYYVLLTELKLIFLLGYYSRFASPVKYEVFGDLILQEEFNASSFISNKSDFVPIDDNLIVHVNILHKINIVYFYSLCRYIMCHLSGLEPDYFGGISPEKFNLIMRAASFADVYIQENKRIIESYSKTNGISESKLFEMFESVTKKKEDTYIHFEDEGM